MKFISMLAVGCCLGCDALAQDVIGKSYPVLCDSLPGEYVAQLEALEYEAVLEDIEARRKKAKRRRKTLPELDPVEEYCKHGLQKLKAADRVLIIDSVVVDKDNFLAAYTYSNEVGTLRLNADKSATEFLTERGNMSYRAEYVEGDTTKRLRLVSSYMEDGKYTDTRPLEGFTMEGDANYPFMMADGMTFYFAARGGEGLGNYDLYATRYDSESDCFYQPENMGYPYNSYANDYMLVIDDMCNVGWFASDRYQPEGKVCVYMFVPNESRNPFDYENTPKDLVRKNAMLRPINLLWNAENQQERVEARQRLSLLAMHETNSVANRDFELVINDLYTYYRYSDFKSEQARSLCRQWQEKKRELQRLRTDLDMRRMIYHNASEQERKQLRDTLLALERQYEDCVLAVKLAEKTVRNTEIEFFINK